MTLNHNQSIGYQGDRLPQDNDEGFIGYNPESQSSSVRDRFREIKKNHEKLESTSEFFKRTSSQFGARAYETIIGLPGNFKKAFLQTRDFLEGSKPEEKKLANLEKEAFGTPEVESIQDRLMNPPTSSDIRKEVTPVIAEKMGEERDYLEPKGKLEEAVGELTQDITSFFLPGTGQLRMAVRLGAPIAGNLAKHGAKFIGANEKQAEQAKLGIMLATTIAGQSNPAQFARDRIAQAQNMIPQGTTVNASPLANLLMPLYNRVTRGLGVPSKSRAIQGMRELAQQVDQNGRLPMRTLMDARNDINEWIQEAGGWDIPVATRDRTLANLNELKSSIIETIDTNLATRFPEAGELYRTGYEAAAVTHQSNAISNFIEKHFGRKVASIGAKTLFPGLATGSLALPKTAAVGAAVIPVYKAGQILYRVGNSPTLAQYYSDVLRSSSQGNVPVMVKSLEKLDKALLKEEKEEEKKSSKNKKSLEHFKSRFKNKG